MSSLGFQTVYWQLNRVQQVRCERVFLYREPQERDPRSLESAAPLREFHLVGFSLSSELDEPNVLKIMSRAGIPLQACERKEQDPLVFLGGTVAGLNPSPLLPYIDGLLAGEGEDVFYDLASALIRGIENRWSREKRISVLSEITGIWTHSSVTAVDRAKTENIGKIPAFTPVVSGRIHFRSMFVVEAARGCPRNCLFCAGAKISHPYRFVKPETLLNTVDSYNPGAPVVGLEGAALSDYPGLESVCNELLNREYRVSLSSLRPDRWNPELMRIAERSGIQTVTMAPETGNDILRSAVGKPVLWNSIEKAVQLLGRSTVRILKLYFLVGLPGEKDSDIEDMADMIREIYTVFSRYGPQKSVRVSVNAFIPKPFTEFQWAAMADRDVLMRRRKILVNGLKSQQGIEIIRKSVRMELMQGLLSVGGSRLAPVLKDIAVSGMEWKRSLKQRGIDPGDILHRPRQKEDPFPWDFIRYDVSREKLWNRYQAFLRQIRSN
jgi:radical SAM superfamily enzyme YgiQ (UPF0313 family)